MVVKRVRAYLRWVYPAFAPLPTPPEVQKRLPEFTASNILRGVRDGSRVWWRSFSDPDVFEHWELDPEKLRKRRGQEAAQRKKEQKETAKLLAEAPQLGATAAQTYLAVFKDSLLSFVAGYTDGRDTQRREYEREARMERVVEDVPRPTRPAKATASADPVSAKDPLRARRRRPARAAEAAEPKVQAPPLQAAVVAPQGARKEEEKADAEDRARRRRKKRRSKIVS